MIDNLYLIWSNEHKAWWKAAHGGYTQDRTMAGHYFRDQAIQICKEANRFCKRGQPPEEIPVLLSNVIETERQYG